MDIKSTYPHADIDASSKSPWYEDEELEILFNFSGAFLFLANPLLDFMGSW